MKAKFLFILLSVLFIIPTSAAILNKHKHKIRLTSFTLRNKATTRSPIEFNIDVQETNSCLQIIFLSPLPDAPPLSALHLLQGPRWHSHGSRSDW